MYESIKLRAKEEGLEMIKTDMTVRELALKFGISKSSIHKDLKERLKYIDLNLYKKVQKVLKNHRDTRHIKGGESTRLKYKERSRLWQKTLE